MGALRTNDPVVFAKIMMANALVAPALLAQLRSFSDVLRAPEASLFVARNRTLNYVHVHQRT
jgi:hypothetical protein